MSQAINEQLSSAIELLNSKQKKAVLGIVKALTERDAAADDHWQNEKFVAEMESRLAYYKNGGKMITADNANEQIKELLLKGRNK